MTVTAVVGVHNDARRWSQWPARASSTELSTHLVDEVVETAGSGRADVHAGALANRLEPLEDGDVLGAIGSEPPFFCAAVFVFSGN